MSAKGRLPVWVPASRPDGTVDELQVGYAVATPDGFVLHLNRLRVGGRAEKGAARVASVSLGAAPEPPPGKRACATGSTPQEELERLARRCERVLADPKKARWHEDERQLLSEIRAELERKRAPLTG